MKRTTTDEKVRVVACWEASAGMMTLDEIAAETNVCKWTVTRLVKEHLASHKQICVPSRINESLDQGWADV